jgi:hypothetical protein
MPGMTWTTLLNSPQPTAAGASLNTSATLTDISVAPQFTLPANFLTAGSALHFSAWGTFSTTATPTLLLGIYYGGVAGIALAASLAITTGSGVTTVPWRIDLDTDIWTAGSSGTASSQGVLHIGTSVSAHNTSPLPQVAQTTVTVDTTAAKILTVGAQWGTSSASNICILRGFKIFSDGL